MTMMHVTTAPLEAAQRATTWEAAVFAELSRLEAGAAEAADDEFDPPSPASFRAARAYAAACRNVGDVAPTRVVPDGSGGIAFETLDGHTLTHRVEFADVGTVDRYTFDVGGQTMTHERVDG